MVQLAPERPAVVQPPVEEPTPLGLVAAAAAVRGVAVAASGLIMAAGLGLVLWAITPASGSDTGRALQGGLDAFAAANLIPMEIGGVALTMPPLLLTILIGVLMASTARRGRFLPSGRYQETVSILVTSGAYGLVVAAVTRGLGTPGAVPAAWVWSASALAVVASTIGLVRPGSGWYDWWLRTVPSWARRGVHGAGIGVGVLIGGGALALAIGLIGHFGTAVAVAGMAAPTWLDGLGLAVLGLAYLPNAVIAGVGYVTGVGFEIGPGTYSPLANSPVDLPAVPLFAAVPEQAGRSLIGLGFLLVPLVAGYLLARPALKNAPPRAEQMRIIGTSALLTGALVGGAAAIARGGIGSGRWSTIGVQPLLLGVMIAVEVGVVAVAVVAVPGLRRLSVAGDADAVDDAIDGKPARRRRRRSDAVDDESGASRKRGRRSRWRIEDAAGNANHVTVQTDSQADSETDPETDSDADPQTVTETEIEGEIAASTTGSAQPDEKNDDDDRASDQPEPGAS